MRRLDVRRELFKRVGVDLTRVPGLHVSSVQQIAQDPQVSVRVTTCFETGYHAQSRSSQGNDAIAPAKLR